MKEHPALVRLTKAEQMLELASDLSEIKKIIDVAEAARVYIRAAKIGEGAARHAERVKLLGQRKAGECLSKLERAKPGRNREQVAPHFSPYRAAIQDAGIEKTAAKRYQQVAAIPEPRFKEYIEKETREITTSGLLKEHRQQRKEESKAAAVEQIAKEVKAPRGPFRVIVADPPWKYGARAEDPSHRARNPYPDMSVEQIKALPVGELAHKDCILWLWTTNAFLRQAFECLDAWGFENKTVLTWVKDRMGLGDWLRGQTEHCLMAVRGRPVVTLKNQTTALVAPLRQHSRKPDEFYALVESLCPGNRLEMFAREPREGWHSWGAETGKYAAAG